MWMIVSFISYTIIMCQVSSSLAKYRAFALPSAGTLPFMQSLFCDFGTGKDTGPYFDMPTFPNAT